MARGTHQWVSFTSGELSPKLEGRIDLKDYFKGCRSLQNMVVLEQGGAAKRQGTGYIATAKVPAEPVCLRSFESSSADAYILEFGEQYIRFYKNGGQVGTTVSGVFTPYELVSPYDADDVFELKTAQQADTMYITHPDYEPRKMIRYGDTNWTIGAVSFDPPPFMDENTSTTTLTPSAASGTITLTASTATFDADHVGSSWKISGMDTKSRSVDAENQFTDYVTIDDGEDIIYTIDGSGWTATVTLQRSFDGGSTWLDYLNYTSNVSTSFTEVRDEVLYRIGVKTGNFTSGTISVSVSKSSQFGYVEVSSVVSDTVVSGTVIQTLPSTSATTDWAEGAWSDYRGYPTCVTFWEGRLVFGGTYYQPQTIWASQVDDYENFETGTGDDDSYNYTLVSNSVNTIRWMVAQSYLFVGTIAAEFKVGSSDAPTTPSNVNVQLQTTNGVADIPALIVEHLILFIQKGRTKLKTLSYDYQIDKFRTKDLSARADHLFEEYVGQMAYASRPIPTLYIIRDDGYMITSTFIPEHGVVAFAKQVTDGDFESVAVIPGGDRDEVWVVVQRNINGSDTRYIEQFQSALWYEELTTSIPNRVLPVQFYPPAGTYTGTIQVYMYCGTAGAQIYYTDDGTDPDESSTRYTGPVTVDENTTLRAIAYV